MKKPASFVILIILILWVAFISYPSFYWFWILFSSKDYDDFRSIVIEHFQDSYLVTQIDVNYLSFEYYTVISANLWLILCLFLLLIVICMSGLLFLYKNTSALNESTFKIYKKQWILFSCILLSWLTYKVFLFHFFPLHIDEVFDFVFFTRKDLPVRHSYQVSNELMWMNNHVFYTDISSLFSQLGFSDKLAIRLPSIIAEAILLIVVFLWARKESLYKAIFTVILLILSFWSSIYSIQGRSYFLLALFCFTSFIAFDKFKKSKNNFYLLLLLLSLSLGLSTNKLFLIPCFGLFMFLLVKYDDFNIKEWLSLICVGLYVILLTLIFYFPVLLLSGWKNVIPMGGTGSFHQLYVLFPLFFEGISVMTNINYKAYIALLLLPIAYLFFRKHFTDKTKDLYLFFSLQFISLILFSLITTSYLPFRAMIYLNVIFSILIAYSVYDLSTHFGLWRKVIIISFIILWIGNTWFNFQYSWVHRLDKFIYAREFYKNLDKELNQIQALKPARILIEQELHFHSFYSKLKFADKTFIFDSLPKLKTDDVIISLEHIPNVKIKMKSKVDDAFIHRK
jgi:hypothetical protein